MAIFNSYVSLPEGIYNALTTSHIWKNCSNPTGIPLFRFCLKATRMCLFPNGDQKEQHDKISSFTYHHFSDYIENLEWSFKVSPIFQTNPHECETITYRNQKTGFDQLSRWIFAMVYIYLLSEKRAIHRLYMCQLYLYLQSPTVSEVVFRVRLARGYGDHNYSWMGLYTNLWLREPALYKYIYLYNVGPPSYKLVCKPQ